MEQFLTGDIWKQANKYLVNQHEKTACIAYITSNKLKLSNGDSLICDASDYAIKYGQTSAKIIMSYYNKGVKVFSNGALHSKMLLTEKLLIIGSANLSQNSAEKLTESSILTDSDVLIAQAKVFCFNLLQESHPLNDKDIKTLLKIKVIKRPFKPVTKSETRQKIFGNRYWFISASPLKDKTYDKIKDKVEETTSSISQKTKIDEENIRFLRWRGETKFTKNAKEGDQIILKLNNEDKTRSYIYPPSVILKKEVTNGFTYFYHEDKKAEERKISWTKFQSMIKNIALEKNITARATTLSQSDIQKLKFVWKIPEKKSNRHTLSKDN
ncbi:phospholipase D-like domain-containing protein [Niastella sp. OAS944]|uniref:phospholipase D-like domain-containing protein n=1 Tax=Niastella sp. OAS944 TaxID=2664089 RepID=UPI00346E3162|nr:hypothetical protein [Chitinophagaceae bacterium OAS944]